MTRTSFAAETDGGETRWDQSYKENRRRQERMQCTIEERLARGEDPEEAFHAAMLEETSLGLPDEPSSEIPGGLPEEPLFEEAEEDESDDFALWSREEGEDEDFAELRGPSTPATARWT